jgi:hypothetical protein
MSRESSFEAYLKSENRKRSLKTWTVATESRRTLFLNVDVSFTKETIRDTEYAMSSPSESISTNLEALSFGSFLLDASFLALSHALFSFGFLSLAVNLTSTSLFGC